MAAHGEGGRIKSILSQRQGAVRLWVLFGYVTHGRGSRKRGKNYASRTYMEGFRAGLNHGRKKNRSNRVGGVKAVEVLESMHFMGSERTKKAESVVKYGQKHVCGGRHGGRKSLPLGNINKRGMHLQ